MALISCPECKKEISDKAPACPHCGFKPKKKPKAKPAREPSGCAVAMITIIAMAAFFQFKDDEPRQQTASSSTSQAVSEKDDCPAVIMSGDSYVTSPDWFSRNGHCLNSAQKQKIERELHAEVKTLPANKVQKNRDGYKGLTILNPQNEQYKAKLASYEAKLFELNKRDKYGGKIGPYALSPYTKKGYPKLIAQYGSRLKEIKKYRRRAAEIAVDSGKCDYVTMSELSTKSSLKKLMFWVDCRNKERIYLTERELRVGSTVRTQAEKAWTKESALQACERAIKARALIPKELSIHSVLGTSFYEAPVTHKVVLHMDFDAMNALGVDMAYTATCHFAPGEVGTIDIKKR